MGAIGRPMPEPEEGTAAERGFERPAPETGIQRRSNGLPPSVRSAHASSLSGEPRVSEGRHDLRMTTSQRRLDRGLDQARLVAVATGAEIRLSRRGAGVSIRTAAASVGMSETMFGRVERGRLPSVTVRQLATACAAVGLKFAARSFLDGDPVRDAGHARLLERLHRELPAGVTWRTEVPVAGRGDPRAWDAQCRPEGVTVAIEAEMRLSDLQAVDRRVALKRRDGNLPIVVLLVADTVGNRRALVAHRASLRASFPLDTRAVLAALRLGRAPTSSGIVVL
jgi:transcriptional regulator with XRE-family HTH domain